VIAYIANETLTGECASGPVKQEKGGKNGDSTE
jgi:hypothetical protein